MTSVEQPSTDPARPPEIRAAALPLEPHEGLATVAVREDVAATARLVTEGVAVGDCGHLVGDLVDGDRARARDDLALARWRLEAQIGVRCQESSRC